MSSSHFSTATSCWRSEAGGSGMAHLKLHAPYARREGIERNVVNANAYPYSWHCQGKQV